MEKQIEILIPREEIAVMVNGLAKQIVLNSDRKALYTLTVLIGARRFANDTIRNIQSKYPNIKIFDDDIRLSSYGNRTETQGWVDIVKELKGNPKGKDIIVLEDLIDTGITMNFLRDYLINEKGANSVRIVALLSKPSRRMVDVEIDHIGKEIPDHFIFGYGIDVEGEHRNLQDICYFK